MKSKIHPLSDWVLIALDVKGEREENGIIIPDLGEERTKTGKVLAAGPHCREVSVGDSVVLDSYDQKACEVDDKTVMVREDNILATKER